MKQLGSVRGWLWRILRVVVVAPVLHDLVQDPQHHQKGHAGGRDEHETDENLRQIF